jgi:type III pantothenate kinase
VILVIDIGNTTIAFTGIAGEDKGDGMLQGTDLKILFEAKLPTETGRDIPRFLKEAEQLLRQHGAVFSFEEGAAPGEKDISSDEDSCSGNDLYSAEDICRAFLDDRTVQAVAISSVVPADTPAAVRLAEKICPIPPVVISCRSDSGLSFEKLPVPGKLGNDRIADAAWAAACCPMPAMTADLGTATTINVVGPVKSPEGEGQALHAESSEGDGGRLHTEDYGEEGKALYAEYKKKIENRDLLRPGLRGIFLGGMIGAGVRTSLHALRTGTAQLPELEPRLVEPGDLIGRDTDGCMLSSAVVGTAALIEGLATRVEEQLGMPVTLILTGGNARYVSPWIRRPFLYEPSLASKGAAVIALRQLTNYEWSTSKGEIGFEPGTC